MLSFAHCLTSESTVLSLYQSPAVFSTTWYMPLLLLYVSEIESSYCCLNIGINILNILFRYYKILFIAPNQYNFVWILFIC